MFYTVIKYDGHLRTRGKCRKHEPQANVFYISRVLVNVQQERLNEDEKQQIVYGKTRKLTQFHSLFDVSLLPFNLYLVFLNFNNLHRL